MMYGANVGVVYTLDKLRTTNLAERDFQPNVQAVKPLNSLLNISFNIPQIFGMGKNVC